METLTVNQRVVPKANTSFVGTVTRIAYEGTGGFVHFDSDEDPSAETYYSAQELDPAPEP
jgi:hypothetical protein